MPGETGSTWTTLISESSVVLVGTQNAISDSLTKSGDTSRLATSVFEHSALSTMGCGASAMESPAAGSAAPNGSKSCTKQEPHVPAEHTQQRGSLAQGVHHLSVVAMHSLSVISDIPTLRPTTMAPKVLPAHRPDVGALLKPGGDAQGQLTTSKLPPLLQAPARRKSLSIPENLYSEQIKAVLASPGASERRSKIILRAATESPPLLGGACDQPTPQSTTCTPLPHYGRPPPRSPPISRISGRSVGRRHSRARTSSSLRSLSEDAEELMTSLTSLPSLPTG